MRRQVDALNAYLSFLAVSSALTAFDPLVFQATVIYVTVNEDCTVTFLFRDGTEATQIIEKGVRQYVRRQPKHNGDTPTDGDRESPPKRRIAAYCRVSTQAEEQNHSLAGRSAITLS